MAQHKKHFFYTMIHPHTRLHHINDLIGYGVFATEFIPKGTITYVKDALEPEISPEEYAQHPPDMQEVIEKYSYTDERGFRIISWDFGKYVNHCCHCNTMSTGYGFEIAIRDIMPGEEITDEYGIFNIEFPLQLECKYADCRGMVCKQDFDNLYRQWDEQLRPAIAILNTVQQPLFNFLNKKTVRDVKAFLKDPSKYKSVYALKYHGVSSNSNHAFEPALFS